MTMKIKKWLKQRQFSVKFEFKLQDFFIGFYWKTQKNIYGFKHLNLWILIIPTLPIHIHCLIGRDRTEINLETNEHKINLETNIFLNEHRRRQIKTISELFYDSAGRAYPPNSDRKSSWEKTYRYKGKYYKITGDEHHKEWSELPLPKKRGINSVNLKKENYEY